MKFYFQILLATIILLSSPTLAQAQFVDAPKREYRAVWLTTIKGLDWPREEHRGDYAAQRAHLTTILDSLQAIHINTILLQTRIRGDVIYPSEIEPFAPVFSGQHGVAPDYDPLAFAIEECHRRGMQLHAWLVTIPLGDAAYVKGHGRQSLPAKRRSQCTRFKGAWYMEPSHPGTAQHLSALIEELVTRYDIDGLHFDYIRYPEGNSSYPDGTIYNQSKRWRQSKSDWRRSNITALMRTLYAKVKSEFEAVVDKCQVKIVVDPEQNKELRAHANEVFNARDARLASMTDESVDTFYTCIMCQAFSPSHVCIVTPERLGLCGAVSWLDAKATQELDPAGPCQPILKEGCQDERLGRYDSMDEAVNKYSQGAVEKITLYSLFQDPMTSCGCFECICGVEPCSMGVVITCREHAGMTPLGMSFSEMASMTGGGVQTPGFMGHGKHFISSKKFIAAEGGPGRIVWMPKMLKDQMRERLDATALEMYGVENFTDMIADETVCTEDPEELLGYLSEVGHPVLGMEPFDM